MSDFLWRCFQALIVFAVGSAFIYWRITDNGPVIIATGVFTAMAVTWCLVRLAEWIDRRY